MRTFNEEDEKKICDMYLNGNSKTTIRQFFHCRDEAISFVLNKYNISIRKKGLSKNKFVKEDFFEVIDSEEKAYFLGLLFTDGNVSLDKSGKRSPQIRLQLKMSDIEILEKFREILNINSNLIYDKRQKKEAATLSIRNKKLANDLSKYGIVPNKTYLTKHLPDVPPELLKHFLRGLLDGDGSIYQETKSKKYKIDFCSCHQSICEEFRSLCNQFLNKKNTNTIANYGTANHIRFNDQKSVRQLATALYKDSKVSLARKQKLAELLFEDNSEEDIVYSDH